MVSILQHFWHVRHASFFTVYGKSYNKMFVCLICDIYSEVIVEDSLQTSMHLAEDFTLATG